MPMHQGIDLSRFKKISSDEKSSTLRHSKGHEIKIAHGGLSPGMREQLDGMPVHLAEGGDGKIDVEDKTPPLAEDPVTPVEPMAVEQPDAKEAPQAPLVIDNITPGSYTPQPQAPAPVAAPPQMAQNISYGASPEEKMQEHVRFATDMANGHIQPKTYGEMFADKSTLGKIGTLFGLMLSGAGSGLAHQPNMVMEMMNKEIERDLERQKMDKENAKNFLSLQYQHNLQQAQAAEHQESVRRSQIKSGPEAAAAQQMLKAMNVPGADNYFQDNIMKAQQIWTPFETEAKMREAAGHYLDMATKNNPRANAMVQNVVKPGITQENANTFAKGAAAIQAHAKQVNGRPMPVDEDKLGQAIRLGASSPPGVEFPGAIPPHAVPAIQQEKAALTMNRNGAFDWDDSFKNLAKMKFAGQAPGLSAAITGAGTLLGTLTGGLLGGAGGSSLAHIAGKGAQSAFELERSRQMEALRKRLGGNAGDAQSEALINSLLPAWNDTPASMKEAHRKGVQHFQSLEATPNLDTYAAQIAGLKDPFPNLTFGEEKKVHKKGKPSGASGKF